MTIRFLVHNLKSDVDMIFIIIFSKITILLMLIIIFNVMYNQDMVVGSRNIC